MSFLEALQSAATNLLRHKLRTILSMLGMIFGVGAVIAMLSIGAGAEKRALESISRMGLHTVVVHAKEIRDEDKQEIRKKSPGVSLRDADAIREAVRGVETVLPRVEVTAFQIFSDSGKSSAKVIGVSAAQARIADVGILHGRFFDAVDEREFAQVCVIGPKAARDLFGFDLPIGRSLKVNDVWLEVIGVTAAESTSGSPVGGTGGASTSNEILIPVTTAMRKFARDPLDAPLNDVVVQLDAAVSPRTAAELIRELVDRLHSGAEDYEIIVPENLLAQSRQTQRIFKIVMGSIAGISLLVGGIGIMNIMLASVIERTREIGVRRAIGATQKDIRTQFLIESFSISMAGGLLGIAIGGFLAKAVALYADWPTVITASSLIVSTGVSMTVGVLSGLYPAKRAAELDPIDALRYE